MNIPKYVQELIHRRCKLANQLLDVCYKLDCWLDKKDIECESYDTHTGVEIYCNPYASAERVTLAILNSRKEEKEKND